MITSGQGLVTPETVVTAESLRALAAVPIDPADARYRVPLERTLREIHDAAGPDCDFVLLGSVATQKYLDPLCRSWAHDCSTRKNSPVAAI